MAKGRKATAAALRAAAQTKAQNPAPPLRKIKPFTDRNDPNGATLRELDFYKILGNVTRDEAIAWEGTVGHWLGRGCRMGMPALPFLAELLKELPAVLTFLPVEPTEPWDSCANWWATTKAPKYTGQYATTRELDPEFIAAGATPLLAALALLASRLKRDVWAWAGGHASPRFQHYDTVHAHAAIYKPLYPSA